MCPSPVVRKSLEYRVTCEMKCYHAYMQLEVFGVVAESPCRVQHKPRPASWNCHRSSGTRTCAKQSRSSRGVTHTPLRVSSRTPPQTHLPPHLSVKTARRGLIHHPDSRRSAATAQDVLGGRSNGCLRLAGGGEDARRGGKHLMEKIQLYHHISGHNTTA